MTVKVFKFSLGSFGAFLIFAELVHVVSQKQLTIERNGLKFGPLGKYLVYRVLLTLKCSSSAWGHVVHF